MAVETLRKKNPSGLSTPNFRAKLSAQDRIDCLRLREKWEAEKTRRTKAGEEPPNLTRLSRSANYADSTASHYLHGRYPLNIEWKMRFARELISAPQAIWPEWEFANMTHAPVAEVQSNVGDARESNSKQLNGRQHRRAAEVSPRRKKTGRR